jgi:hypothetical protein
MDASEYLRYKKAAQGAYISRQQPPMDAGMRTMVVRKAAERTFVPAASGAGAAVFVPACCTARVAYGGGAVTPVKPASGCESAAMCAQLSDRYTATGISTPCCPFPYTSTSYLSVAATAAACRCTVGTRSTIAHAVAFGTGCCDGRVPPFVSL